MIGYVFCTVGVVLEKALKKKIVLEMFEKYLFKWLRQGIPLYRPHALMSCDVILEAKQWRGTACTRKTLHTLVVDLRVHPIVHKSAVCIHWCIKLAMIHTCLQKRLLSALWCHMHKVYTYLSHHLDTLVQVLSDRMWFYLFTLFKHIYFKSHDF